MLVTTVELEKSNVTPGDRVSDARYEAESTKRQ